MTSPWSLNAPVVATSEPICPASCDGGIWLPILKRSSTEKTSRPVSFVSRPTSVQSNMRSMSPDMVHLAGAAAGLLVKLRVREGDAQARLVRQLALRIEERVDGA